MTPPDALKGRVLAAATGQSAPRPAILTRVFWAAAAVILFSIVIGTLTQPDYERYDLVPGKDYPKAAGHVLWYEREIKIRATGLARLEPGKIYELWHIPAATGKPIPAGAYSVDEGGRLHGAFTLDRPVADGDAFAVTIEEGLKPAPKGAMPLTPGKPKKK